MNTNIMMASITVFSFEYFVHYKHGFCYEFETFDLRTLRTRSPITPPIVFFQETIQSGSKIQNILSTAPAPFVSRVRVGM